MVVGFAPEGSEFNIGTITAPLKNLQDVKTCTCREYIAVAEIIRATE